jgi:hypothetical protein
MPTAALLYHKDSEQAETSISSEAGPKPADSLKVYFITFFVTLRPLALMVIRYKPLAKGRARN